MIKCNQEGIVGKPSFIGGNQFIVIGFSYIWSTDPLDVAYGTQIFFGFASVDKNIQDQGIAIRSKYYTSHNVEDPKTWNDWKRLPIEPYIVQSLIGRLNSEVSTWPGTTVEYTNIIRSDAEVWRFTAFTGTHDRYVDLYFTIKPVAPDSYTIMKTNITGTEYIDSITWELEDQSTGKGTLIIVFTESKYWMTNLVKQNMDH